MAENTNKKRLTTFRTCMFALLCVVMLALGVHFTVAAFTANSFLKAVATTNQSDSLFSSDTLVGYTTVQGDSELNQNRQTLVLSAAQDGTASFSFNVRNHLKDNREVVNPKDVFYTLTVEVQGEGLSDLEDYGVTCSSEGATTLATRDGGTFAFQRRTLQGNFATTDTFTVKFPAGDIGKVSFVVKAVASGPGTNLWGLAAKLVSSQAASVESSSVSGNLVLHMGEKATNDAYNYQITVTGKEANVALTWPSDKVEIEPFFEEKYKAQVDRKDGKVTFTLQPGVTTINFYQLNGRTDVTNDDFTCK